MQPIRGEREEELAYDPWDAQASPLGQQDTTHVVNDAGAIESHRTAHRRACSCGCLKPAGGYCALCANVSCVACHGVCSRCHMPICPRHSVFSDIDGARAERLCNQCSAERRRQRRLRGFVRGILSPFIRFKDDHGRT